MTLNPTDLPTSPIWRRRSSDNRCDAIQEEIEAFWNGEVLFDQDPGHLPPSPHLVESLPDSLFTLRLIVYLEETFGIHVDDAELLQENFESIGSIARYVERKVGRPR